MSHYRSVRDVNEGFLITLNWGLHNPHGGPPPTPTPSLVSNIRNTNPSSSEVFLVASLHRCQPCHNNSRSSGLMLLGNAQIIIPCSALSCMATSYGMFWSTFINFFTAGFATGRVLSLMIYVFSLKLYILPDLLSLDKPRISFQFTVVR